MQETQSIGSELLHFIKAHRWHLLLAIPGVLAVTVVHELAHAVPVWLQGGTVTEFVWIPTWQNWGHIRYQFPHGASYSSVAVSLGPYVCWLAIAATVACIGYCKRPRFYRALFVWGFLVPIGDLGYGALRYLAGAQNDWYHAFGAPVMSLLVAVGGLAGISVLVGLAIHKRLYQAEALRAPTFLLLSVGAIGLLLI